MAKFISDIIVSVILSVLKWVQEKAQIAHSQEMLTEEDVQRAWTIKRKMHELRIAAHANRVGIFQFENGNRFSLSNPTWKLTSTYELIDEMFIPLGMFRREAVTEFIELIVVAYGVPSEGLEDRVVKLQHDDFVAHMVYTVDLPPCRWRKEHVIRNIKKEVVVGLRDANKNIFGILVIDYLDEDAEVSAEAIAPLVEDIESLLVG